ncbi:MAG TPA: response regulator, partial [Gemmata sp.]|nr:response regulator [Gemmata sp.]
DLTMPEMSGGDFAVRLRRTLSHSPFLIVMTAPGEEVGELLAVETGFHLWLTKPIDPENLLSILDICRQARDRLESPEVAGEITH